MSACQDFPEPLLRTRLHEQVAEQLTAWSEHNGLRAGDRLPPERDSTSER
ncbi:MAG TPA: hypothetical protein VFG72_11785 [Marmoricola sp.]|nr:hypothetical protein [Marmoricola sp.]